MLVNRNSSNEQIMADATVRTVVDAGNVILFDKKPTSNPSYTTLYFFGYCELSSQDSAMSAAQRLLLGWSETSVFPMRCQQNASTEVADKLAIGTPFSDFALRIVDSNLPSYEGQTPRQSKSGETYFDAEGNKIYRNVVLVTKQELADRGHHIINRVSVKTPSVGAEKLLAATV